MVEEDAHTLHFGPVCLVTRDRRTDVLRGSGAPHWRTAVAGV